MDHEDKQLPAESDDLSETTLDDMDTVDEDADLDLLLDLSGKKKKKPLVKAAAAAAPDQQTGDGEVKQAAIYDYNELLARAFSALNAKTAAQSQQRHVLPPPQVGVAGKRKSAWVNFAQICSILNRSQEHVMSFVLAELGVEGTIDSKSHLNLGGTFRSKQMESLLKKYIGEFVACAMCRSVNTTLERDPVLRMLFLECSCCHSKRSVAPIDAGYRHKLRADKLKAKMAVK